MKLADLIFEIENRIASEQASSYVPPKDMHFIKKMMIYTFYQASKQAQSGVHWVKNLHDSSVIPEVLAEHGDLAAFYIEYSLDGQSVVLEFTKVPNKDVYKVEAVTEDPVEYHDVTIPLNVYYNPVTGLFSK